MYRGQYNFTLGLHARIQEFSSGGGGPVQSDKKALTTFFFLCPQLILQKSNGQFQRNLSFFKVPEGFNIFRGGGGGGGVQLFPGGGVQLLISYRNPYNVIFQGGSGPPVPPLCIRTWAAFRLHGFIRVCISDSRLYKNCI